MRHEIWLCNDRGTRIADLWGHTMLERATEVTATRIANDVGTLTLGMPATFDPLFLRRDMIIQVWRAPEGIGPTLFRSYFLRGWGYETKRGETSLELYGRCPNDLMRRRIVAGAPSTPRALKGSVNGDTADDIMKEIVAEAQLDAPDSGWPGPNYGTRVFPNFSVEADTGKGPLIDEIDISYEYLLQSGNRGALAQVVEEAAEERTEVYWDVVPLVITGEQMTFIFRTRVGQPGQDLTSYGVLFSQEKGNLTDCSLVYDYGTEENYIYGVKEDGPYNTKVQQKYSRVSHDASIWNRCEGATDINVTGRGRYLREYAAFL